MFMLSFLSEFMYVISGRLKKVRSHSFSSSDKTIHFLPRVSASFTRIWYHISLLTFSYAGWLVTLFRLVWCTMAMLALLKRTSVCSRQVVTSSLGTARPQHSYFWRAQAFFFDGITSIALFHLSFWFGIFQHQVFFLTPVNNKTTIQVNQIWLRIWSENT